MRIWTREELESLGMEELQINTILKTQELNDCGSKVNAGVKNEPNVVYGESDITTISEIKKVSGGTIVELPSFDGVTKFIAKLKRPSLLTLVSTGKIPNALINQATELFQKGAGSLGKDNTVSDMYEIMEAVCKASMVNPTYDDIKSNGLSLTDEQMMAIFSYTQQGVKALEQFR